jgi:hypothetical protein
MKTTIKYLVLILVICLKTKSAYAKILDQENFEIQVGKELSITFEIQPDQSDDVEFEIIDTSVISLIKRSTSHDETNDTTKYTVIFRGDKIGESIVKITIGEEEDSFNLSIAPDKALKISEEIRERLTSDDAMGVYTKNTKRHLYERLYRISGEKKYLRPLEEIAISLYKDKRQLIDKISIGKRKERQEYHLKTVDNYLKSGAFKRGRGVVFKELTDKKISTTFLYEFSLLTYLRHIKEWGLENTQPFKNDFDLAITYLKKKLTSLQNVLLNPKMIEKYSAQTDN